MRYLTGCSPTPPRGVLRDEVIPFHLGVYERLDRLGTWAAESTTTGQFLGWFHFRPGPDAHVTNPDLDYRLRRSVWNKGYATEGSRALIKRGLHRPWRRACVRAHHAGQWSLATRDGEMRPDAGAHDAI